MTGDIRIDEPLARAVLARALKMFFQYPGPSAIQPLSWEEGRATLAQAADLLDPDRAAGLREAVASLPRPSSEDLPGLAESYQRAFGHTLRGKVCPYGTEYGGGPPFQQEQELADVAGFYLAFGLRPPDARTERPDHVACEFEFLEFLSLKEAYAAERGDDEMHEVTRRAARRFLKEHLGRFGVAFGASLTREDTGGFYGRAGSLCVAFLRVACARLDVRVGPEFLEMRPATEDNVPMACGDSCPAPGPDDLAQIGRRR